MQNTILTQQNNRSLDDRIIPKMLSYMQKIYIYIIKLVPVQLEN